MFTEIMDDLIASLDDPRARANSLRDAGEAHAFENKNACKPESAKKNPYTSCKYVDCRKWCMVFADLTIFANF